MVLAAGLGTRLRPLSTRVAKPVVPVLNRPLLHWTLLRLAEAGVRDVVVNTHHRPTSVSRALGDGARFGLRLRYSHERTLLGTGGALRKARTWLGDGPILVVNGDVLFDFDLRALVARHRLSGAQATLGLLRNPDPARYSPVVSARDGRILAIAGRPRPARGTLSLFSGVHVLEAELLERLPRGHSDSVRDLYWPLLAEGALLQGLRLRGTWYDLGAPPLYRAAHLDLLKRGFGGVSHGMLVAGSAQVASDAHLRATVVGAACRIATGARVSGSVLWERVTIGAGAAVSDSILASGVRIAAGAQVASCVVWREGTAQCSVPLEAR
jgi:NDP-sugar pyrophosphorylase family protein